MKNRFLFLFLFLLIFIPLVNATETYQVNTPSNLQFLCTLNNAIPSASTTFNITIYYPDGAMLLNNAQTTAQGQGSFNYSLTFPQNGDCYKVNMFCTDGNYSFSDDDCYKITPTGTDISDVGQISSSILYLYVILAIICISLGFMMLNNKSVWISYSGLFFMIIGFTFVYYDLHLANLYASTIALNSGAENTTSGIFVLFINFLKLAPYIVAGIVAFASVKLLRQAIKKKNSSDGWDNGNY